ncbi:metallo-beta-lactamase [Flavobacterium psychrophilum]|nr:metallo-beta-lactamase [Flavobacterium psychrophilum]AOE53744.1 metallo-beta-lactamase [Flavobacterium psychrophilum]
MMTNVKMRVWDVKHGNAIYLRTPNNKHLVYDLGRGDYSENSDDRSPLETLYDHYGVRTINYLMITHPHRDHIDDILNLDKFKVISMHKPSLTKDEVVLNYRKGDNPKYDKYFELDDLFSVPSGPSTTISNPENFGGLNVKVFSTPSLIGNLNNKSLLSVIEYESIKVIIPGDNEFDSLDLLMKRNEFKAAIEDCDILIAPHHGRESAYHKDFVKLANPLLTIVSDGSLCDTSANHRYSSVSRGWTVHKNGVKTERKMLTTNSDGEVYIDFGRNEEGLFLQVVIK